MSDNTEVDRLLRQIRDLKAEMDRCENVWATRLREADERAEHILRRTVDRFMSPPVLVIDKKALGDVVMEPGTIITAGEWPKTERTVIEVSEVVYFRDFLRSLWRRLRRHRKV